MRLTLTILMAALMLGVGVPAFAELQNVEVGGSLRIRTNWFGDADMTFDDDSASDTFTEQRTMINVKASFTDNIDAFVEFDHYNFWGDDFRSDPVTGDDFTSSSSDVQLYQAYIDNHEVGGYPIDLRVGRQEIQLGSEWLIGNNDTSSLFRGLSFDGALLKYNADEFSISAYVLKLVENGGVPDASGTREKDEDTDLFIIYGSYTGLEDITIDAYWMLVDAATTRGSLEDDSGQLHTIGARVAGTRSQFDWEAEAAYQFGDALPGTTAAAIAGGSYMGISSGGPGGNDAEVDALGAHAEAGYTFDIEMQPRVFLGGAYYEGGDVDSNGLDYDAPFNRLFSDYEHSEFLANTDMSNVWLIAGGASAQVTEELELTGVVTYFQVDEDYGSSADDTLGIEVGLYATYQYSEDLTIEVGYAHFFTDDGIEDGNAVTQNGLGQLGGSGEDDDLDYFFLQSSISF